MPGRHSSGSSSKSAASPSQRVNDRVLWLCGVGGGRVCGGVTGGPGMACVGLAGCEAALGYGISRLRRWTALRGSAGVNGDALVNRLMATWPAPRSSPAPSSCPREARSAQAASSAGSSRDVAMVHGRVPNGSASSERGDEESSDDRRTADVHERSRARHDSMAHAWRMAKTWIDA